MCVTSMIGDHYNDKWSPKWIPDPAPIDPNNPWTTFPQITPQVTKQEFDELKKEVLEMKELLKKAIEYDKKNNQPECQMEEKIALLKKVAELVGVSLEDVLGK